MLFFKVNLAPEKQNALYSSSTVSMNVLNNNSFMDNDRSMMMLNSTIAGKTSTTLNNSLYVPQIIHTKASHEYIGILEWKIEDEAKIITKLIEELKPRLAITLLPGLPSYVLMMCIRYADMLNDEDRVRTLLNSTVQGVKRLIKVNFLHLSFRF